MESVTDLLQLYLGAAENSTCMNDRRKFEPISGTFDAERFWRDPNLAKLPSFHDPEMENIVMAMDELLFPFCEAQDKLITRYRMNVCHKEYLHEIGFKFLSNSTDLESPDVGSVGRTAIYSTCSHQPIEWVTWISTCWTAPGCRPLPSFRGWIVLQRVTGWNRIFQLSKRFRLSIRSCIQPN